MKARAAVADPAVLTRGGADGRFPMHGGDSIRSGVVFRIDAHNTRN